MANELHVHSKCKSTRLSYFWVESKCYTFEWHFMAAKLHVLFKVQISFFWFESKCYTLFANSCFFPLSPSILPHVNQSSLLPIDPPWCYWSLFIVQIASSCYAVLSSVNILSFPPSWCLGTILNLAGPGLGMAKLSREKHSNLPKIDIFECFYLSMKTFYRKVILCIYLIYITSLTFLCVCMSVRVSWIQKEAGLSKLCANWPMGYDVIGPIKLGGGR